MTKSIILSLATIIIFLIGLGVRLYDLTDQPLDFHSTRQLRSAIIARGMYYQMSPEADPETRQQAISFWNSTGQYEPSILESLVARTYRLMGSENVWVSRIYTSLFWIIGGVALFALALRMSSQKSSGVNSAKKKNGLNLIPWVTALIAVSYYLLLPFGVQASRSFQPDPGMVMWIILSIYSLYRWSENTTTKTGKTWGWAIATGVFGGIAIITKAVAAYIIGGATLAMVIYNLAGLENRRFTNLIRNTLLNPQIWVMAFLMLAPTGMYYLTRGGRASEYFQSWTISLSHLLLDPSVYVRWFSLVENLMNLAVVLLALLGVLIAKPRNRIFLVGLWMGYFIYGLFLPYQMYTHNYYHLQLIPIIALSILSVVEPIVERLSQQSNIWQLLALGVAAIAIIYSAWLSIYPLSRDDYSHEPPYWAEIGSLLPTDGKILALTQDYGYRLMYYGWRKVVLWPTSGEVKLSELRGSSKEFDEFFEKRIGDKSYFLITSFNQFNKQPVLKETLYERYPIYAEGDGYLIFDLSQRIVD